MLEKSKADGRENKERLRGVDGYRLAAVCRPMRPPPYRTHSPHHHIERGQEGRRSKCLSQPHLAYDHVPDFGYWQPYSAWLIVFSKKKAR